MLPVRFIKVYNIFFSKCKDTKTIKNISASMDNMDATIPLCIFFDNVGRYEASLLSHLI